MNTARAMSEENVELVRRAYEDGWFDQDPERLFALAHPEMEVVNPSEAVEAGTRRGLAEVRQAWLSSQEAFDESRHELRRLHGTGDVVIADVTYLTRSRGSEVEVAQDEAHTWTFRDGRIVRFEWGRNLGEALEAAGLSE